jgi:hypothetical protein
MSYWKLLGSTAILMIALCVGIHFYAKWDLKRFEESLGEPPAPISEKMEPTENLEEQTTFGKTGTFETTEVPMFVKQEEAEPQITNEATEEVSPDEFSDFLDLLGDEAFAALSEKPDVTAAVDDTFVDVLQEQSDNSWKISSIEGLDSTVGWIEIDGNRLSGIINLEDLGIGDTGIIDVVIE